MNPESEIVKIILGIYILYKTIIEKLKNKDNVLGPY